MSKLTLTLCRECQPGHEATFGEELAHAANMIESLDRGLREHAAELKIAK